MAHRLAIVFAACWMVLVSVFGAESKPQKPLTNADVVKLVKLGLGDDVVIAKIKQAGTVEFQLEPDDLGALKSRGVSGKVMKAMLDRASGVAEAAASTAAAPTVVVVPSAGGPPAPAPGATTATLEANDGRRSLSSHSAEIHGSDYLGFAGAVYAIYPGAQAAVRTRDLRPSIVLKSDINPTNQSFLVRLEADAKDNDRSLKIGSFWKSGGGFSTKNRAKPDPDWTVPYDATEASPGLWRITPQNPLVPGEYGIYDYHYTFLMDFGVDGEAVPEPDEPSRLSRLRAKVGRKSAGDKASSPAPSPDTASGTEAQPAVSDGVTLYLTTPPNRSYKELGRVSAGKFNFAGVSRDRDAIDGELKSKAAKLGANAVINITEDFANVMGVAVRY